MSFSLETPEDEESDRLYAWDLDTFCPEQAAQYHNHNQAANDPSTQRDWKKLSMA